MYLEFSLLGVFSLINIIAFSIMAYDKRLSRQGGDTERVPEGMIFFIAAAFGGIGVYLGMLSFRHKTRKWYFQIGVPLLILQNFAVVYIVLERVG